MKGADKQKRSSRFLRLEREEQTMAVMVAMYCRDCHSVPVGSVGDLGGEAARPATPPSENDSSLCPECAGLLEYARGRLARCPFQEKKPTCARCPVHCYRPEMRARARAVMRYAGPRMLLRRPVLAIRHLLDGLKKPPAAPGGRSR